MTSTTGGGSPSTDGQRFVDLHMHSTASDGSRSPDGVVAAAADAALSAIALTDHDTLDGVETARAAGERLGVRVIAGVELSAMDGQQETHLLGLHLSRIEAIERTLAHLRAARRERAERIVARLHALGVPVTMSGVLAQAGAGAIGRPHIARAVVAEGFARDVREVFDRWLGNGRPANVPKHRLSAVDAIALIHTAGGIAVFAHPGTEGTRARVEVLCAAGLDGLEVRHPSHTSDDVARLTALAEHFDLVPSGGSDWHGSDEGPRRIGGMRVPADWLTRQEARVVARSRTERVA